MALRQKIEVLLQNGYEKYKYGEYKKSLKNFSDASDLAQKSSLEELLCISVKMEATALYRLALYKESEKL